MQQLRQTKTLRANKALVFFSIVCLYCCPVFSQAHENSGHIYSYLYVDTIPKFKGGAGYLNCFIKQNLKWPDNTEDVQGTVLVSFVVLSDGNIANVKIEKPLFPAFDAEAIRFVKSMPKWVPGKVGNKVVDIKMYFPVDFNVINE